MKTIYIYSDVYLKSGNIVKTALKVDSSAIQNDDLEDHAKKACEMMSKIYIGESDAYEGIVAWGALDVVKGKIAFRSENVEAAVVTYKIIDD